VPVADGDVIDLLTLALGEHTLTVYAVDKAGNEASKSVTFSVTATPQSLKDTVDRFYDEGKIDNGGIYNALSKSLEAALAMLNRGQAGTAANKLNAFINLVQAQAGKHIDAMAADVLIADAMWVIAHLP
jgi:arabinoxylan arabinofuranohydrolase